MRVPASVGGVALAKPAVRRHSARKRALCHDRGEFPRLSLRARSLKNPMLTGEMLASHPNLVRYSVELAFPLLPFETQKYQSGMLANPGEYSERCKEGRAD